MRLLGRPQPCLRVRDGVLGLVLAALVLRTAPALAGDEAAAEALFLEGKRLAAEGKLAEACPKFAESNRLDRGAGTLIHLADCYEKNGQSASAWATFTDAASAAQALGRADWQRLASTRAAALAPKLAKLTLRVSAPVEKLEVTRDGALTSQASWGTPIPVDVGMHAVTASAPGYQAFRATVLVKNDGERKEVVVALEPLSALSGGKPGGDPSRSQAGPGAAAPGSTQRTLGFVIGGVGVAGVAAGAITGLVAMTKNNTSKRLCPNDGACASADAVDANDGAKTFSTVSTIAFIAGGVGLAVGGVLLLTAPSAQRGTRAAGAPRLRVAPTGDGRSAGMAVLGVF
jgi:hypothetical protein